MFTRRRSATPSRMRAVRFTRKARSEQRDVRVAVVASPYHSSTPSQKVFLMLTCVIVCYCQPGAGMRKIGLVLDMRREPPRQKITETALFAGIENGSLTVSPDEHPHAATRSATFLPIFVSAI